MKATLIIVYRTRSLRRSQRWAWRLVASNGRTIATSGEGYSNRDEARCMAWLIVVDGGFRGAEIVVPS